MLRGVDKSRPPPRSETAAQQKDDDYEEDRDAQPALRGQMPSRPIPVKANFATLDQGLEKLKHIRPAPPITG